MILIRYLLFETHRLLKNWYTLINSIGIVFIEFTVVILFGGSILMYLYLACQFIIDDISKVQNYRNYIYGLIFLIYGLISYIYMYDKKYEKIERDYSKIKFLIPARLRTILIILYYSVPFFLFFS